MSAMSPSVWTCINPRPDTWRHCGHVHAHAEGMFLGHGHSRGGSIELQLPEWTRIALPPMPLTGTEGHGGQRHQFWAALTSKNGISDCCGMGIRRDVGADLLFPKTWVGNAQCGLLHELLCVPYIQCHLCGPLHFATHDLPCASTEALALVLFRLSEQLVHDLTMS
jgi:hypothetical protein